MNRQRIAVFAGIVSLCLFSGEVMADTIVSGDLKIRDGNTIRVRSTNFKFQYSMEGWGEQL